MSKRNTRRRRQELLRRSRLKDARAKAANLLAYQERKEEEKADWELYRKEIADCREKFCFKCPLNLLCMAQHCPEDVMICTQCASVFSDEAKLVIYCDGYNDNLGLERAWHSGLCPMCYERTGHVTVVHGFSVDTPEVRAIKRAQQRLNYAEP